jgi:hypothetical protein
VAWYFVKQAPSEIYLLGVYYGAADPNVVFAYSRIVSADTTKSRRSLEQFLKVVVVIYIVEY